MANIQLSLIRIKTLINALKDKWQQITGVATTSFQQFVASIASYDQGKIDVALNAVKSTDKGLIASIIETSARASSIATQPFTNNSDIMWVQEFVPTTNKWSNYFNGCTKLKYIEGTLDLSNATSISNLFSQCRALIKLPNLILPNAESYYNSVFGECASLKTIPSSLIINASNCATTFHRCRLLESVLCTINSSNCTTFAGMFYECQNLKTISHFDTSKGTNFTAMFSRCTSLTTTAEKHITLNLQNVDIWYQLVGTTQNSKINNIFYSASHINHVVFSGVYNKIASDVNLTVFGFNYLNEDSIISLFKCFRPVDEERRYIMTLNATQKAWEITLTAAEALERFEDEEVVGTYTLEEYSELLGFVF